MVGLFLLYAPESHRGAKPETSPDGSEQAEQAPRSAGKSSRCSRRVPHVAQFWFVPHIPDGAGLFVHVCLFRLFVSLRGVEEAKLEARQESLNKGLAERKVAFTADQLEDIHVVCTAQST